MSTDRGAATRQLLLDAAAEVFSERGYASATTKEIAAVAGMAEGTIYRHFESKQELFKAVFAERRSALAIEPLEKLTGQAGTGTVRGNIKELVTTLLEMEERMAPLVASIGSDIDLRGAMSVAAGDDARFMGPVLPLATYLAAEQKIGRVRAEIDVAAAAFAIFAIPFAAAIGRRLAPAGPEGAVADVSGALDVVLEALEPRS